MRTTDAVHDDFFCLFFFSDEIRFEQSLVGGESNAGSVPPMMCEMMCSSLQGLQLCCPVECHMQHIALCVHALTCQP